MTDKLAIKPIKMPLDDVSGMTQCPHPLPRHAHLMLLIGPPGSGKTSLMTGLLCNRGRFYNRLFDQVHWVSHSTSTLDLKAMGLPKNRLHSNFSTTKIKEILDGIGKEERALIVLDDVVTSLKSGMPPLMRMIFNRRHIGKGVSIWITSQKLTVLPLQIRSAATCLCQWATANNKELKAIFEEYITLSDKQFKAMTSHIFARKHGFLYMRLDKATDDERYFDSFRPIKFE